MSAKQRTEYLSFRRRFEPKSITLVIVAESPPDSGKYFYNPEGAVTEPLFAAMMLALGHRPRNKQDGLLAFQRKGWVLVDATYQPVNGLSVKERDAVIGADYHLLSEDLQSILPDKSVPIILVKANIHRLLHRRLTDDGFSVGNGNVVVYFPSHGRQSDFQRQFGAVLKSLTKA